METKHTPGPFIAWDDGRTIGIEGQEGADGWPVPIAIAEIVDHGDMADPAQMLADQALLTAAPELLEALERAYSLLTELRAHDLDGMEDIETLAMVEHAIAKAKGESK